MCDCERATLKASIVRRLSLLNKQRITLSAFLAYFCVSGALSSIGLVSGPMAEYFGASVTEITANFSWLTVGLLVGAGLALYVVQRFPLRAVQLSVFALIAGSLAALRVVPDVQWVWPLLGVVGVSLGVGLAAAASTIAGTYADNQRASMLVITDAAFSIAGWVCAGLTLYFIGQAMHWSSGYLFVAAVAGLVVVLAAVSTFPGHDRAAPDELPGDALPIAGDAPNGWPLAVWLCIGALCLYTLGQYAMLWWLPQHLQSTLGAPAQEAGVVVGRFWAGMFAAQMFVSWWVLKVGVRKLVLIASVSAFVLSLPMWLVGDVALVPWLGALWGFWQSRVFENRFVVCHRIANNTFAAAGVGAVVWRHLGHRGQPVCDQPHC